jgi:hypothetical protein
MPRPTLALAALGSTTAALTWGTVATTRGWPVRLPLHLLLFVAAGGAWALSLALLPRLRSAPGHLPLVLVVSVALRVPAWRAAPAHSDDLHRYLWDGRVQQAGINPYRYAPDAEALAPLRDGNWARINNRQLPTIYPPLAQLAFRLAARAPSPEAAWRAIAAGADLGLVALLGLWLRRRREDPRRLIAWGWSPLAAIELGQNAHVEGLGIALLVGALFAVESGRRALGGALLGASAAVKLLAAAVVPGVRSRRAALAFALALAALSAPYLDAGTQMSGSLGEYGRRWRGNDGAFALLHAGATAAVEHTRFHARYVPESPRLARFITGRDRDTVFPDEAANFAARAVALGLCTLAFALALFGGAGPVGMVTVVLGAFVLLTPILHPWYVLWVVPLVAVAVGSSPAWCALAALAPLGYEPLGRYLVGEPWRDPIWTRALEHGLAWALLLWKGLTVSLRPLLSSRAPWRAP